MDVQYEIYLDSLFLVNFVMNFYLLCLVNKSLLCPASKKRVCLGAAAAAGVYLLPFWAVGHLMIRTGLAFGLGLLCMLRFTFGRGGCRVGLKLGLRIIKYGVLLGGSTRMALFLADYLWPGPKNIFRIMGLGAVCTLGLAKVDSQRKWENFHSEAVLVNGSRKLRVGALIDSGNSLVEPISGAPVSVIDKSTFAMLWQGEEPPYRVIPFRSVGEGHGLMKGYCLPEMSLSLEGVTVTRERTYVAVAGEPLGGENGEYSILVNPRLLQSGWKGEER